MYLLLFAQDDVAGSFFSSLQARAASSPRGPSEQDHSARSSSCSTKRPRQHGNRRPDPPPPADASAHLQRSSSSGPSYRCSLLEPQRSLCEEGPLAAANG